MPRHSARLADLGIALAACAAFSSAILGDIAANNFEAIIARDYPRPLYALLILNMLVCSACYLLGWRHFLYAWPLALFLFFRFGSISNQIGTSFLLPLAIGVPEWSGLLWIAPMLSGAALLSVLLLWSFILRRGMRKPRRAAWMLLFFSLGTAYPSLDETGILFREAYRPIADDYLAASQDIQTLMTAQPAQPLPDIIALIPDRYPSNRALREAFEYGNEEFGRELERRGFVVLDDLRANYQTTLMSLTSSTNLQLLESEDGVSITSLYAGMRRNLLAETLVRNGYEYVHLAGWFGATMHTPLADRIYNGTHFIDSHLTELETKLLMLTPIYGAYTTFVEWKMSADGHMTYECQRLKRQLQYLRSLKRSGPAPLFVWAHIYIPHAPLTMDAGGNCLAVPRSMPRFESVDAMNDRKQVQKWMSETSDYRKMFIDYMQAFNGEALAIFDEQRQRSGEHGRELIFAILSDEGSRPILWTAIDSEKILYERSAPHVLREKFGIFGAIYSNRIKREEICSLKSRVNVWRMILGNIFNVDLPPVDDIAQMASEEMKTAGGMRYLGGMRSVRDRLGPQLLGGRGCEGISRKDSPVPGS